jgi:hypothetical protein
MLFKQKDLEGIRAGIITRSFRNWKKLSITVGSEIKTSVGIVKIDGIEAIALSDISEEDAVASGFSGAGALKGLLASQREGQIYRIAVRYLQEDARISLRAQDVISEEEFALLKSALERLDKASKLGSWTFKTLIGIQENPQLKAAELAVKLKKEKEWLKLNVRKLKGLGLTFSHEPGYTLSPRGEAYLKIVKK